MKKQTTLPILRKKLLESDTTVAVMRTEAEAIKAIEQCPGLQREGCVVGQPKALYARMLQKQVDHNEKVLRQIKLLKDKVA